MRFQHIKTTVIMEKKKMKLTATLRGNEKEREGYGLEFMVDMAQ